MISLRSIVPLAFLGFVFLGCDRSKEKTEDVTDIPSNPAAALRVVGTTNILIDDAVVKPGQSTRFQSIVQQARIRPTWAQLQKLTDQDKAALNNFYREHKQLSDRGATTWALAVAGDEETVALFLNTLTNASSWETEQGGKFLTDHERFVMESTVLGLGLLGAKYDSAFCFLTNATTPRFWATNTMWKSGSGADEFGVLASHSIAALGITGRSEVPAFLESLRNLSLVNDADPSPFARRLDGGVLSAAFNYWLVGKRGQNRFREWYFQPPSDIVDADGTRAMWKSTEEGKSWQEWRYRRLGLSPP